METENQKSPENGNADGGLEDRNVSQVDPSLPSDGGFGWVCVAACFTVNCFTWGVVSVRSTCFVV